MHAFNGGAEGSRTKYRILDCFPGMNGGLVGVERHEGESLITEFSFLDKLNL